MCISYNHRFLRLFKIRSLDTFLTLFVEPIKLDHNYDASHKKILAHIRHPTGGKMLRDFCVKSYCEENVDFVIAVRFQLEQLLLSTSSSLSIGPPKEASTCTQDTKRRSAKLAEEHHLSKANARAFSHSFLLSFNFTDLSKVDKYLSAKTPADKKAIAQQIYETFVGPKAPTLLNLPPDWERKLVSHSLFLFH